MEANKEEAQRCVEAAKRAMNVGERDKASRLLHKAQKMYSTEEAQCKWCEAEESSYNVGCYFRTGGNEHSGCIAVGN